MLIGSLSNQGYNSPIVANLTILPSSFEEISPVWQEHLWDSKYKFEPVSCMLFMGGHDEGIRNKYSPYFLKAVLNGAVVGVISAHQTSQEHFRLRGLYVFENYRNMSVATALIVEATKIALSSSAHLIWAAPRHTNLKLFENLNFVCNSPPTHDGFLYGPNCYVSKNIR